MNKWILMAASLLCLTPACSDDDNDDSIANPEAKKAASLINDIRKNPDAYSSQMGVDLSEVSARSALAWNDALAKVAQAKAEDMALQPRRP
jgi:uncharacterized protein YkwD